MDSKHSYIKYPEVYFKDVIGSLWRGIKQNRLSLFVTVFCVAAASSVSIIVPLYYKRFFDILSSDGSRALDSSVLVNVLLMILLWNAVGWLFWRIGGFVNISFQVRSMARLRQQAFNYLLHHSYSFFANNFTGAIVQRIGRYARAFEKLTDRIVWNVVPLTVRLAGVVIVIYTVEPRLAFVIVGWAFFYMVVNYFYSLWRLKYNIQMAAADSRTTAVMADSITNQNNIDIFSRHGGEKQNFKGVTEDQMKITKLNWNINTGLDAIQAGLIIAVEFAVFYYSIGLWKSGAATIGIFVLIQLYLLGLGSQLWDFSRIIRDFYESYADAKEMVEMMKLPYEVKDLPGAMPLVVSLGEVEFDHVDFSFNRERGVLRGINLRLRGGEKMALVGPSGSGKTTLVRLLLRFYDVPSGEIFIDHQDIKNVTLDSLRGNISLVPQDPLLFHRTIRENIRYGKPQASDGEVAEAARLAHCDEFIKELPNQYDTYVGERGIKLSGGERQRVAIARAILKNAPILILDEATSSLDSHSESLIQDAMDTLMKDRTTIVIAHRLATIRKMDRIIVLDNGSVREEGTHDELISRDSFYKKLWSLQAGGFIS